MKISQAYVCMLLEKLVNHKMIMLFLIFPKIYQAQGKQSFLCEACSVSKLRDQHKGSVNRHFYSPERAGIPKLVPQPVTLYWHRAPNSRRPNCRGLLSWGSNHCLSGEKGWRSTNWTIKGPHIRKMSRNLDITRTWRKMNK